MTRPPAPKHSLRRKLCGCLFAIPESAPKLYSDKAYDFNDWEWHKNAAWRHRMEPWTFFLVASGFVWQLAHVLIASIIVGLYHEMLVPLGAPHANSQLTNAMGMVTGCLSLLLVFRTNSSYSRWWEARILWGSVVNLSRNYARQVMLWAPPERTSVARLGARWMAIAVHVMRAHLRQKHLGRVTQEASHLLTLDEFNWLAHWRSAPQGAAHVLAWSAANLGIDYQRERVLQDLIVTFINNLGACERILRTPMPTAYTRHTSRFLLVYITLAPAMLWPTTGWATPFCALLIGFLLLGTENIGVQIEEPFKVLPLDTICNTIENSIRDMELRHYGACSMDKLVSFHDDKLHEAKNTLQGAAAATRLEALLVGKLAPLTSCTSCPGACAASHPGCNPSAHSYSAAQQQHACGQTTHQDLYAAAAMLGSSPGGGPGGAAGKGGGALGTGTMARGQGGDCLSRNSQATNDGDLVGGAGNGVVQEEKRVSQPGLVAVGPMAVPGFGSMTRDTTSQCGSGLPPTSQAPLTPMQHGHGTQDTAGSGNCPAASPREHGAQLSHPGAPDLAAAVLWGVHHTSPADVSRPSWQMHAQEPAAPPLPATVAPLAPHSSSEAPELHQVLHGPRRHTVAAALNTPFATPPPSFATELHQAGLHHQPSHQSGLVHHNPLLGLFSHSHAHHGGAHAPHEADVEQGCATTPPPSHSPPAGTSKLGKLGGISLRHRQTHSVHSSMEVPSTHFMEGVSCTHHFNRDELVEYGPGLEGTGVVLEEEEDERAAMLGSNPRS